MRTELETALAKKYPFMCRQRSLSEQEQSGRIDDLYGAFGCECSDGWYEILDSMCAEITKAFADEGRAVDLIVDQIKEKFGTLRFYYHFEGQKPGISAIDFLGQGSLRISGGDVPIHKTIAAIVRKWEERSAEICEKCGKPGKLRKDRPWIRTLCEECNKSK